MFSCITTTARGIVSFTVFELGHCLGISVCCLSVLVSLHCLALRLPLMSYIRWHENTVGGWWGKNHLQFALGWTQPHLLNESWYHFKVQRTWQRCFGVQRALSRPQSCFCYGCFLFLSAITSQLGQRSDFSNPERV